MLRCTIRDRPIVDDERSRCRTKLDNAAVSDEIVVNRQIKIRADEPSIDPERKSKLRAYASNQRLGYLLADCKRQNRIAEFGEAVHLRSGVDQAADRTNLGFANVEQVTGLAGSDEGCSVGVRRDGVDDAGTGVAIVLPTERGESLREEVCVGPSAVSTELIGICLGGAGVVE